MTASKFKSFLFITLTLCGFSSSGRANNPVCVDWALDKIPDHSFVKVTLSEDSPLTDNGYQITSTASTIEITASNPRGAMYGVLRVHDFLRTNKINHTALDLSSIPNETFEPKLKIRADNPFLHLTPDLNLSDTALWQTYIDQLAEFRFNTIDFHGAFDPITTDFPNLFPLLVTVPGFDRIGDAVLQKKNLKALQQIIQHAHDRCVDVGLMNYTANVDGLSSDEIESYTAKAVETLINSTPGLAYIGFRVGESGRESAFFKNAYLKGIQTSQHPEIALYTRSWQTSKEELEKIGTQYGKKFLIEIKYNGEQLGLPYQAIHEGGKSYSYQDYLTPKTSYDILWQVRANGTHRFFSWMNIDFIKRAVQSFHLGNASGFTLEPHSAYFPMDSKSYFRDTAITELHPYIFQKNWMWFAAWGRLAYNPEDQFLHLDFVDHFGKDSTSIMQLLDQASQIVPLVFSYRYQGPDHRNYSPETETGNFWVTNTADHHYFYPGHRLPDLMSYSKNKPMDQRSFVGIAEFVDQTIDGKSDGRITPPEVVRLLQTFASELQLGVEKIAPETPSALTQWQNLKSDLLSLSHLANYHALRITAMLEMSAGLKLNRHALYLNGVQKLSASRDEWQKLSHIADQNFKPLVNRLRINAPLPSRAENQFQWISQWQRLNKLDATQEFVWINTLKDPISSKVTELDTFASKPEISLINLQHEQNNNRLQIKANFTSALTLKSCTLWYKTIPSEALWQSTPMIQVTDLLYTAIVPFDDKGLMYHVEVCTDQESCRNLPSALKTTPWNYAFWDHLK